MPKATPQKVQAVQGIDVSHHQGSIDWKSVAKAGILFAFAKLTEGDTFVDSQFARNWSEMKDAGILRGAYHFFRPAKSASAQAEKFIQTVGNLDSGDLPPMLDLEETQGHNEWTDLPQEERVAVALGWLDLVEDGLDVKPIVYTRRGFVTAHLGDPGRLTDYPLWIAHYTKAAKPAIPSGWKKWTIWQYSETGKVSGIPGNVDMDRFNGPLSELKALARK